MVVSGATHAEGAALFELRAASRFFRIEPSRTREIAFRSPDIAELLIRFRP